MKSLRIRYIIYIFISMILGLLSRYFNNMPSWINLYFGDIVYAIMFYFIFAFVFIKADRKKILAISIIYLMLIETSQLYNNEFLNNIRNTTIGHLLLGKGFLISDIFSYIFGSIIGYKLDKKTEYED